MPAEKLRPLLTASKKIPVQAAFGLTSDGDGLLLLDRKATPRKVQSLLRASAVKAKLQLNASSLRYGRAEVDPEYDASMIRFFINKEPPATMRAKLVDVVKRVSFSKVEFNVDTTLEEITDDDDAPQSQAADPAALALELAALIKRVSLAAGSDAALRERLVKLAGDAGTALKGGKLEDAAGSIASLRDGVEAAPTPPAADAALLRKELAALIGRIPEAAGQDASRKTRLATLAADANTALKAADLENAGRGIAALRAALGTGQTIPTTPVTEPPKPDGSVVPPEQLTQSLRDDLGAPFLRVLLEAKTPVETILKLQQGFGSDPKPLQDLLEEGGFAAKPKALVALFFKGCDGKPDKLVELCSAFASSDDRKTLRSVIEDGGLGDAPDALGELLAIGCGGKPDSLKKFGAAFDDEDKRNGLKNMLINAKLKGETDKNGKIIVDPRCLAWLLKEGAGPAPTGFSGDDDKRKSDALAKLCGGMKGSAPKHIGAMLEQGGLGTEPAVFSHLVGLGCQGGDPIKLGDLGAELNKDPANLKALDDLLKTGALGTTDDKGDHTKTDPRCLGQLYGLGCERKPGELVKLANALGGDDRSNLAEIMTNGGLGTRPEIFGNAYKFGCVTDPYDDPASYAAPSSTKDPAMLKNLLAAFGATADAPKLEEMLNDGGLGTRPEWLGKIMRDSFTDHVHPAPPPLPSGRTQDPGKLKDLHAAFAGAMPKLKVMIEAMGEMPASCGEADEPGRALQNVHKSANVPIDQLQSRFFDTISARAGGINGAGGPTVGMVIAGVRPPPIAASLTTRELIQNAASMEFDPLDDDEPTLTAANGKDYLANLLHVMERHHRHAPAKVRAINGNNSSMFPKMIDLGGPKPVRLTEAMIRDLIKDAIGKCNNVNLHPVPAPPPPRNAPGAVNPPKQHGDMNAMHQRSYRNVPSTIPGATFQMTIGFSCVGPLPLSAHAANPAHDVRVGQSFPTGGTNVVEVNDLDYVAIKAALGR